MRAERRSVDKGDGLVAALWMEHEVALSLTRTQSGPAGMEHVLMHGTGVGARRSQSAGRTGRARAGRTRGTGP